MWLQKLNRSVTGLAYSPDSKVLYSADMGGRLRRWNIAARTGKLLMYNGLVQDAEPYGRGIHVLPDGTRVVIFAYFLSVVDPVTGDCRYNWVPPGFPRYGHSLLTPDGRLLAVRADKRAIITWNVLEHQPGPVLRQWPPRYGLTEFDLTPDGRTLAVLERRGHVAVIDMTSGAVRCRFRCAGEKMASCPLLLSPDGNTLVVHATTGLEVWDVSSGAEWVCRLAGARPHVARSLHPTAPVCASFNRKRVFTLFDLRTGEPVRSLDLRLGKELMCVCFSPDVLTCAAGGSSGRFAVFDVDL
jgi:WD40 repeat protein